MRYNFALAKDIVLSATYETLVFHSKYETFDADEVFKRIEGRIAAGYVRRLLSSLAKEGLVTVDQYDESSPTHYTLSDEGIKHAEGLPLLADLLEVGLSAEVLSVPASDRIVSINHNQRIEIEAPLDEVIKLVEAENSIGNEDGFRELTVGRLRAGRELIRAGVFTLRSLQLTLIVGLQMLIEKYGDTAITLVAAKLLDLLLAQYGIV